MDTIDRAILTALQANGALSHAELATRVGASTASCWRRIKGLEASGILLGTVRLVDATKVDCGVNVMCHVRLRSHAFDDRSGFEAFVETRGEILECYSMSGEWDYLLRIVAGDIAGYDRFLMRTLLEHPCVATASSHFAMSQTKYTTALPVG